MMVRLACAFCSGSFLALAGSLVQATTHNPLASTATLGMTGAIVGLMLVAQILSWIFPQLPLEVIALLLFVPAFGVVLASLWRFANTKVKIFGGALQWQGQGLLLVGLTFNLAIGALFSVMQFVCLSMNWEFPHDLWFGSFKFAESSSLWLLATGLVLSFILSLSLARDLELMSYGADFSWGLRVPIKKRVAQALAIALLAEAMVTIHFGVFGLASLMFPLFWRQFNFFGRSFRREIIFSPWASGLVMMALDFICYECPVRGSEIPVGLLVMLVGSLGLMINLWQTHLAKGQETGHSKSNY